MPISQLLKDSAKIHKVRITYTNSFGKRKHRSGSAVKNAIKKAKNNKKKKMKKMNSSQRRSHPVSGGLPQRMKQFQQVMYANRPIMAAGAAGAAGGAGLAAAYAAKRYNMNKQTKTNAKPAASVNTSRNKLSPLELALLEALDPMPIKDSTPKVHALNGPNHDWF